MIFVQWPLMVLALAPVILIETIFAGNRLALSYKDAFIGILKANLFSTAFGIPLAWLIMLLIEFAVALLGLVVADFLQWKAESPILELAGLILTMAWLGPLEPGSDWIILFAASLLLIPCFYISVWMERRICVRSWATLDPEKVRRVVFLANAVSYGVLFVTIYLTIVADQVSRNLSGKSLKL